MPPGRRPTKRKHQEEPEDIDDSDGEDEQPVGTSRTGQRTRTPRP